MKKEIRDERISVILHGITGIAAGYLSSTTNVSFAFLLMIVILIFSGFITDIIVGKRGTRWWISNGAILYIFTWFVIWVYIYNMR